MGDPKSISSDWRCPHCGELGVRTLDTRFALDPVNQEVPAVRRRRECKVCRKRHTTYEIMVEDFQGISAVRDIPKSIELPDEELRALVAPLMELFASAIRQEIRRRLGEELEGEGLGEE